MTTEMMQSMVDNATEILKEILNGTLKEKAVRNRQNITSQQKRR